MGLDRAAAAEPAATLLSELRRRMQIDLSREEVDSTSMRTILGGINWTESDGSSQGRLRASPDH